MTWQTLHSSKFTLQCPSVSQYTHYQKKHSDILSHKQIPKSNCSENTLCIVKSTFQTQQDDEAASESDTRFRFVLDSRASQLRTEGYDGKNCLAILCWIALATKAYHVLVLRKEVQELYLCMKRLVYLPSVESSLFSFKRAETVQVL